MLPLGNDLLNKSAMSTNSINRGLLVPCEGIEPNHLLITNQLHDLHANKALLQLLSLMNRFIKHISPATDNHEQELDSDSFSLPGCTKPTCQSFGSSALLIGLSLVFIKPDGKHFYSGCAIRLGWGTRDEASTISHLSTTVPNWNQDLREDSSQAAGLPFSAWLLFQGRLHQTQGSSFAVSQLS